MLGDVHKMRFEWMKNCFHSQYIEMTNVTRQCHSLINALAFDWVHGVVFIFACKNITENVNSVFGRSFCA